MCIGHIGEGDVERYIRFHSLSFTWNVWRMGRICGWEKRVELEKKNVYKKPTTSLMAIGTKQQKKYKNFFITHISSNICCVCWVYSRAHLENKASVGKKSFHLGGKKLSDRWWGSSSFFIIFDDEYKLHPFYWNARVFLLCIPFKPLTIH